MELGTRARMQAKLKMLRMSGGNSDFHQSEGKRRASENDHRQATSMAGRGGGRAVGQVVEALVRARARPEQQLTSRWLSKQQYDQFQALLKLCAHSALS